MSTIITKISLDQTKAELDELRKKRDTISAAIHELTNERLEVQQKIDAMKWVLINEIGVDD